MAEPHTRPHNPSSPGQMSHRGTGPGPGFGQGPGRPGPGFGPGPGPGMMMPKERAKDSSETLRTIWNYLKQQYVGLWIVLICTAIGTGLSLAGPYLMGISIDRYILTQDLSSLIKVCLILLAVYAVGTIVTWIQQYVMVGVTQHTVRSMHQDLFIKFQSMPLRFFDSQTHGELMSRTTNDIQNVSNTLNQSVTQLISSVFMLVGSVIIMLRLSLWMTLVTVITIPLVTFIARKITRHTRKFFTEQQKSLGEMNGFIEETISGQRVVTAFQRQEKAVEEFREINRRLRIIGVKAQSLSGSMGPIMNAMSNLSFAVIAIAGGWLAFDHIVTIGILVSFLNYSRQFSQPINQLANQYNMVQSAIAGAERVFEVLNQDSEYENDTERGPKRSELRTTIRGDVEFQNVSFGYQPEVPVLKNVSLRAKAGDTIALVGPTGAGKTTIVNLLTRFYDIQAGTIQLDGKDLVSFDKNTLRSQLGIVLQDAYLFSDTIRENIRYGQLDATDQEVEHAARLANADTFIRKLPHGYDTMLNAEGSNLSQGQKQLITIARAILSDPSILILDEATSNVDTRTEMHIQEAMHTLMKGRTSFVIAHRLSTIRDADCILVINGGEIIERGTHDQLLAQKGYYHDLFTNQFTKTG